MDIKNIKPTISLVAKKEQQAPKPRKKDYGEVDGRGVYYKAPTTNEDDFIGKPVALAVRQLLEKENISHRTAAAAIDIAHATLSNWISPKRIEDCPKYILPKIKEELKL